MAKILIVCGAQKTYISEGRFNRSLVGVAQDVLEPKHDVKTTFVEDGYDPEEERKKWLWADSVILQFPVFWFSCPSILKAYMDTVYVRKVFYDRASPYGSGGLLKGKTYLVSTTWNAPEKAFGDPDTFYGGLDVDEALVAIHKAHQYIGMEPLPSFTAYNVIAEPSYDEHEARFREHLLEIYS